MRSAHGFTLVELVTIMVILGVLAVVAIPRLGGNEYRAQEFADKTISALRYAQKSAVSHRRTVCVSFTSTSLSLAMDINDGNGCVTPLILPGSNSATLNSPDAANAQFSASDDLSVLTFNSQGGGSDRSFNIPVAGQSPITINVVGGTGYINYAN